MSVNYPISPHLADYAQSINQAKFGFTAKKNRAVHVIFSSFIFLKGGWVVRLFGCSVVRLRQLVVMKNNERASGQNLFHSYLHSDISKFF